MHGSYSEPVPVWWLSFWKLCRCAFPGVLGGHVQLYAIVIYTNVGDLEMYNLVLNVYKTLCVAIKSQNLSKMPPEGYSSSSLADHYGVHTSHGRIPIRFLKLLRAHCFYRNLRHFRWDNEEILWMKSESFYRLLGSKCIMPKKDGCQKMFGYFDRLRLHGSCQDQTVLHTDLQPLELS